MESTEKWDRKYLELAKYIALNWSKDPSTKVGAVLVNYEMGEEFIGYNGFPRGVDDSPERYNDRELKYRLVVHAEVNALIKAGKLANGSTLYVWPSMGTPPICNECVKIAIQKQIREVVGYAPDETDPRVARWAESYKISRLMLQETGIIWRTIEIV